ncbi:MAG: Bifunctional protein FolD [Parachlamydiales bacterium]|nr:Bifunctional protein FolD [Parachlamydiales bacterium]
MKEIDGKKIASEILSELKIKIAAFPRQIGLAFILVGENPASQSYVRMKKKTCAELGIRSIVESLSADIASIDLLTLIDQFNRDPLIDGILIQLPLPRHLDPIAINRAIDPAKDVDGFHPINMGKLLLGETDGFIPCTPNGVKVLLERSQIHVGGKHVVIVGRSNIVGKPLAALLMQKKQGCNATVTIAHSQSENLSQITKTADILIAAIGQPRFIRAEMIKPGAVVIDVGINRVQNQIVGDVDYETVAPIASRITPVPGGVGPMTIAMLMENTYESALRRR